MTESVKAAQLFGFINPTDIFPGFVVPVFRRGRGGNELLVQEITPLELVSKFRLLEVGDASIIDSQARPVVGVNEPAVWGFAFSSFDVLYGSRDRLSADLSNRRAEVRDSPFVDLQILRFGKRGESFFKAISRAYKTAGRSSKLSADVWLDNTFLLPFVREQLCKFLFLRRKRKLSDLDVQEIGLVRFKNRTCLYLPEDLSGQISQQWLMSELTNNLADFAGSVGLKIPPIEIARKLNLANKKITPSSKSAAMPKAAIQSHIDQFDRLLEAGDHAAAELLVEELLNLSGRNDDVVLDASNMQRVASLRVAQGKFDDALTLLMRARDILAGQAHENDKLGWVELNIAEIYLTLHKSASAAQHANIARHLFERLQIKVGVAEAHRAMAEISVQNGELEKALLLYKEFVLPALEEDGNQTGAVISRGRIAEILIRLGRIEEICHFIGER